MSALTSLLVRDEVVSVRQIEDAISRQVLEGGELDTALLELDAAPENVLNAYCAASFRLPAVARDEVMGVSEATLSLISREQAERYRVVPITHDASTIVVATYHPLVETSRKELSAAIGMQVELCIASELRIEVALAAYYGIAMSPRLGRLAERIESAQAGALPAVEPMMETPISGLAAELFDDLDEGEDEDDVVASAGAMPIDHQSLRPETSAREVSVGRVVEVRASQLPPAGPPGGVPTPVVDSYALSSERKTSPTSSTQTGLRSPIPSPPEDLVMPLDEPPPPRAAIAPAPRQVSIPPSGAKPTVGFGPGQKPFVSKSPEAAANVAAKAVQPTAAGTAPSSPKAAGLAGAPKAAQPPIASAKPVQSPAFARASAGRVANDVGRDKGTLAGEKRVGIPQGPISREAASQLLERADDRDAVIEVFFRYTRQYFDATALCSIREDRVLGREVHNVPALDDIRGLSLSVARGSALEEVLRTLKPQVVDLSRKAEDRPLVEALRRANSQPSALMPVCIQRRVVAIVYGDRGGEFFGQRDLGAMTELLPEVSRAFERIIRTRKVLGLSARDRSLAHAKAELGNAATQLHFPAQSAPIDESHDPAKAEALLRNARRALSALGAPRTAPPPPGAAARLAVPTTSMSAAVTAREAPAAMSGRETSAALAAPQPFEVTEGLQELDRLPTARLPAVDAELEQDMTPEPAQKPPAYMSKPPPGFGRYSSSREGEGDEPTLSGESESDSDTRPIRGRTSKRPRDNSAPPSDPNFSATADTIDNLEVPRFESPVPERVPSPRPSKPPPGTGVYSERGGSSEVISLAPPRRSSQPSPKTRRSQPPRAPSVPPPRSSEPRLPDTKKTSRRPPPPEPRREDPTPIPGPVYSVDSKQDFASLPSAQPRTGPYAPVPREASVIVDTLGQTRGLIDDLCNCGPDDEGPTVQSLLLVGDEAIDLLIERFPGPLWFDRRRPYARLPFGRDTGPIARALAAFGERALSRVIPLMRSPQADVRYYATLFASDQVHPELLVPIAERLFDEDAQIRLMVRETLPAYRSLTQFAQVLGSLRTRMLEARAPLPARLAAIDAISNLRDGQSVPALVELLAHADRQLSIPAHRALVAITCQDFGSNTKKWRIWYEDNQHRHRVQWLIDSLMHNEQSLRSAAGIELQKATQVYYGFVASAAKKDRERAQRRYQDWWDSEGRKRM